MDIARRYNASYRRVNDVRGFAATMIVLAMLAVPLGFAASASALEHDSDRDLTPVVVTGPQERLGGGFVGVKAGETLFGVRYGTDAYPGPIEIFAKYTRYLGGADIVDGQGNFLRTHGVPVVTLLGQTLAAFVEFEDRDGDGLLNFHSLEDDVHTQGDVPVKVLWLRTAWTLEGLSSEVVDGVTYVNFTLSAEGLLYSVVVDGFRRPGTPEDGVLDRVAFTFRLRAEVVDRELVIPWYRVTVSDGNERLIQDVEFLGFRDVSGRAVEMGAKYDHDIRGWDFARDANLLALETHVAFGNFFPARVAEFVHAAYYDDHAESDNGTRVHDEDTAEPERPELYTRDRIYFADDWTRVGHVEWVSDVIVDGVETEMRFQVQGGGRFLLERDGAYFAGFRIRGAFIYPNGQEIFHDPALYAESVLPDLPAAVNLTPLSILAVQLAVVGIAMGPALYLRAKARRSK